MDILALGRMNMIVEYLHFLVSASVPLSTIYMSYYNFCLLRLFVIEKLDNFYLFSLFFLPISPKFGAISGK